MTFKEFHILLIDDDEDDFVHLRDLFAEITGSQYKVTWRSTYKEGLEALHDQAFDACLLDYRLGEHTGLDLLKEVQKLGVPCPIIFLTGQGDFELDLQAMQVGAAEYLVKDQLTAPLLERSLRYCMKHALDMQELKESKAQIVQQDRLASLGLLASSLAHEIGTPLGIIRSRAELVERRQGTSEQSKQDMTTVITQIDRIAKLVNSLLHLARQTQSEMATAVNLNAAIQDVLNLMEHELRNKDIAVEVEAPPDSTVMAEHGPLAQVFLNLFVNAMHAIQEAQRHGRKDHHKIALSIRPVGEIIEVNVSDTGCGIPQKNLSRIFAPFFTTKDIGSGTGLGLATSFKLIQSWGGSITVRSAENEGSTFTIKLKIPKT